MIDAKRDVTIPKHIMREIYALHITEDDCMWECFNDGSIMLIAPKLYGNRWWHFNIPTEPMTVVKRIRNE